MKDNWPKYLAEMLATCGLVFAAAAAVLANAQSGGALGTVGVALVTGFALAAMFYSVHHISGAHLNPAITVSLWLTGHVKAATAAIYVVSQLIGAVIAAILVKIIFGGIVSPQYFLGDTVLGIGVTPGMGILVEAVLAFFLVWTFFATVIDKKAAPGIAGLALGAILAASIMIGGSFTMGALNPARSFGPALLASHWNVHYIYWVGPMVGALAAGFLYHFGVIKKHAG